MKKHKKLMAFLVALSCFGSIATAFPQFTAPVYAQEVVYDSFELNYDGWHGTDTSIELTADDNGGFGDTRGMKVTGRTSTKDGAASSKGLYLFGGVKYNYSMQVFSEKDAKFKLTLKYIDEETKEETIVTLSEKKVKGGKWTELSADYKAPEGTYEYELTLTNDLTDDFVFDDVRVTTDRSTAVADAASTNLGLKDEFANYFRVGNIFNGGTINNSAIQGIILKDHNAVECENETKPYATIVQNGSTDTNVKVTLNSCAAILDFCAKNNIAFRGHTFVWHSQTPEWFFKQGFNNNNGYVNSSVMDQRMESYIKNMFNAYATQYPSVNLYAYDVCNEVIYDGTAKTGGLRPTNNTEGRDGSSAWVRVYGNNSFVEKAFTYAKRYAPKGCKLYYNDYNEFAYDKKECIKNTILIPLHNKGLLDGMGMQSHIDCSTGQWDWGNTQSYLDAMDDYLSLGIDVQVTELDISRDGGKYTDQQQAEKYKAIFKHCKEVNESGKYKGKVTLVQVWGPNDNNSWVGTNSAGKPNYPLLYDGNNQPKTAYNYITSIIDPTLWGNGSDVNPGGNEDEPNDFGWYFNYGFENGTDVFSGRGAAKISSSTDTAFVGSHSLYVTNRESAWNGALMKLSSTFKAGQEYSFSAIVSYLDGPETDTFHFTLQYDGSDGKTYYDKIDTKVVPRGSWVQLANMNYKLPEGATNMQIYVETDSSTTSFYIDEVIGAVAGTGILGPDPVEIPVGDDVLLGDVDGDGQITISDAVLAKKSISGGLDDARAKKAADVDRSGKIDNDDVDLITKYVVNAITEFPVAAKQIDVSAMEAKFKNVKNGITYKYDGENNPLSTVRFGADPGWMVYDGRLYIYTTNDAFETRNDGQYQVNTYNSGTINCLSTADMVNWTDHGAIPIAKQNGRTQNGCCSWASAAWAPDACWKMINGKPKFFLYFANSGGGIGVVTADSPTGPWTDPLGHALLSHNSPNCSNVEWMFDPGVYYDENTDEAYLFFGGGRKNGVPASDPGTGRVVKLGKDMISLDGTPVSMKTPYLFEDSSVIKIGDTWYYSYCSNWNVGNQTINGVNFGNADILYMTSKTPLDPNSWTLAGNVFKNTFTQKIDNGGNNHHSIISFKGKYYVAYHSRQYAIRKIKAEGIKIYDDKGQLSADGNYRSTQINECSFNNGKLSCNGDMKGCSQLESLNPYTTVQAETMSNQSDDVVVNGVGNTTVSMKSGSWLKVSGVNFSKGANNITIKGKGNGTVIKVCTGSPSGTVIGYVELNGTMSENTVATISSVSGQKDLYFVASGNAELDSWSIG
ncbi:arabinoxylan arabinofuranohydrolase [Ruminococcus sp. YE71]|nr:endo-1,4-beta-xylanase [Ruminococcus sp. YE78]SDA11210.1 arabinoxylan arabinofuranohydrolase [Ruminococcus sp. YE78]SFW14934.1 arabinoxylan arabinofuranohydrolase [Ruminococcus sp. YE71]